MEQKDRKFRITLHKDNGVPFENSEQDMGDIFRLVHNRCNSKLNVN